MLVDEIQEMVSFVASLIDKCWTGEVHSPEEVMNRNGRENGGDNGEFLLFAPHRELPDAAGGLRKVVRHTPSSRISA